MSDMTKLPQSETLMPTMSLRYVQKGAFRILQQCFTVAETGRSVWKDVPFVGEIDPGTERDENKNE